MLVISSFAKGRAKLTDTDTDQVVAEGQLMAMGGVPAGTDEATVTLPLQFVGQSVASASSSE